jgi:hypothetical protein
MSRMDVRLVAECKQHGTNRTDERRMVSAGQIGSTDRSRKQRVAHKKIVAMAAIM